MAKKRVDPMKKREQRAKIAAAIGVVLFLAIAAYEVPSVMKMMNQKPPPGANATDAGNRNADGSIPLPNVSLSSGLTGNGQLADTDVPPAPGGDQLVAFNVFATKNPFTPQVTDSDTPASSSDTSTSQPSSAEKQGADVPPQTPASPPGTVVAPSPSYTVTTTTTTTAAPTPVTISVNGVASHVGVQGTFPTGAPVFRLVSFTGDTAEISIVGGSYATGDATLTLHVGRPVTLENTTDQKSYRLILVSTH